MRIIAEFRDSIRPAIPHTIELLWGSDEDVRAGADVLFALSEQGNISNFVIMCH